MLLADCRKEPAAPDTLKKTLPIPAIVCLGLKRRLVDENDVVNQASDAFLGQMTGCLYDGGLAARGRCSTPQAA